MRADDVMVNMGTMTNITENIKSIMKITKDMVDIAKA